MGVKKKVVTHLKGDIKGYRKEIKEDKELIKKLNKKNTPSNGSKKIKDPKKVVIAKGKSLPRGKVEKLRDKPGMSNIGKYKSIKPSEFAGPEGTFPINSLARARNALARAHFAKSPASIKRKVYAKYPQLKKRAEERKKGK